LVPAGRRPEHPDDEEDDGWRVSMYTECLPAALHRPVPFSLWPGSSLLDVVWRRCDNERSEKTVLLVEGAGGEEERGRRSCGRAAPDVEPTQSGMLDVLPVLDMPRA